MKKLFETIIQDRGKSMTESTPNPSAAPKKNFRHTMEEKKEERMEERKASLDEALHPYRQQTMANLFREFNHLNPEREGMKNIMEFLIKIAAERRFGYQALFIT